MPGLARLGLAARGLASPGLASLGLAPHGWTWSGLALAKLRISLAWPWLGSGSLGLALAGLVSVLALARLSFAGGSGSGWNFAFVGWPVLAAPNKAWPGLAHLPRQALRWLGWAGLAGFGRIRQSFAGPFPVWPWIRAMAFRGGPLKVRGAQGTNAIDICLKFLMEVLSPHEVGRGQGPGLIWLDLSWLGLESTSGLALLARAGMIRSCTGN